MGFLLRDNPCRNCKDRNEECHAGCNDYQEWHKSYLDFKEEEAKERRTRMAIRDVREKKRGNTKTNGTNLRNQSKLYRIVHDNKIGD